MAFYSRRRCGQAVTNHRFPFRYSRHFIGRTRSDKERCARSPLLVGWTHISLQLICKMRTQEPLPEMVAELAAHLWTNHGEASIWQYEMQEAGWKKPCCPPRSHLSKSPCCLSQQLVLFSGKCRCVGAIGGFMQHSGSSRRRCYRQRKSHMRSPGKTVTRKRRNSEFRPRDSQPRRLLRESRTFSRRRGHINLTMTWWTLEGT